MLNIRISERDYYIFQILHKFKFATGKHIKVLAGFNCSRSCDKRLKTLFETGYVLRKKYLYGFPYLYTLTHKSKMLIGANKRIEKIRTDQIQHDLYTLDTVIYFLKKYDLSLNNITSEKELHIIDGFGNRTHRPDFLITKDNKKCAIEIELTPKPKDRFQKNVKNNFLSYDYQVWVISKNSIKINQLLTSFQAEYSNIYVLYLEEVSDFVSEFKSK